MLSECMAPRLAEARQSISVDFDARVLYAINEAKTRQSKQREEREKHERRRAAILKQEALDRELAKQREIERKYGATRRRREIATERLACVFAVQEHAAAGGVVSPTKGSVSNQHGSYSSAQSTIGVADGSRGDFNRRLLVCSHKLLSYCFGGMFRHLRKVVCGRRRRWQLSHATASAAVLTMLQVALCPAHQTAARMPQIAQGQDSDQNAQAREEDLGWGVRLQQQVVGLHLAAQLTTQRPHILLKERSKVRGRPRPKPVAVCSRSVIDRVHRSR